MFKPTHRLLGGLLWKRPWRLSAPQKARQRKRLRLVDKVVDTVAQALQKANSTSLTPLASTPSTVNATTPPATDASSTSASASTTTSSRSSATAATASSSATTMKAIERWYREMPREEEMLPKDKYTIFDRKEKRYRKGIHKLPKWTRVSQRVNPPGF